MSRVVLTSFLTYTKSHSLANFVGPAASGIGFLGVLAIRLRSLLLAAALSFECNSVSLVAKILLTDKDVFLYIISERGSSYQSMG
jgi:hypothetical protein